MPPQALKTAAWLNFGLACLVNGIFLAEFKYHDKDICEHRVLPTFKQIYLNPARSWNQVQFLFELKS